jgi:predicted acetyltransferase
MLEIRQLPLQEAAPFYHQLGGYAFRGDHPPLEGFTRSLEATPDATAFVGFVDEEPALCAFYSPMTQNVRGVLRACSAVWGVVSHPKVRRRGYIRQAMRELFHQSAETFPFSTLYPFRGSFYGRLGYAPFPQPVSFRLPTQQLRPALRMDLPGTLEDSTLRESFARFLHTAERLQQQRHGMGIFAHADVRHWVRSHDRYAVYALDEAGTIVGVMAYRIDEERSLRVWPFLPLTTLGRYLLLNWLARHIDQCPYAYFKDLPPGTHPNTWLPDLYPEHHLADASDIPMGRVVNLRGLVKLPVGEGSLSVRVHDQHAPWNEGVFRLYTSEGQLYLAEADNPDCELTIHGLSALVYGSHDPASFRYLGWGNPDENAQAALRGLFPPAQPTLLEQF